MKTYTLKQILKGLNITLPYQIYTTNAGLEVYQTSNKFIIQGYLAEGVNVKKKFKNLNNALKYFKVANLNEIEVSDLI